MGPSPPTRRNSISTIPVSLTVTTSDRDGGASMSSPKPAEVERTSNSLTSLPLRTVQSPLPTTPSSICPVAAILPRSTTRPTGAG